MDAVKITRAKVPQSDLILKMMRAYFDHDGIPWNRHIKAGLKQLLTHPEFGQVLLVQVKDQIAGYVVLTYAFDLEFGGIEGTVTDIYFKPEYRGMGLGRQTFGYIFKVCKKKKIRALTLQVLKHNKKALKFYQKLGFAAYDRIVLSKWI